MTLASPGKNDPLSGAVPERVGEDTGSSRSPSSRRRSDAGAHGAFPNTPLLDVT
ncbi:MAG: hypothetical protein QOJ59_1734 [Thermomicrobiales bacterium]|jgi:hypothetical protein|nr:hypothetical protein [Thermomicrobiales bacterium]